MNSKETAPLGNRGADDSMAKKEYIPSDFPEYVENCQERAERFLQRSIVGEGEIHKINKGQDYPSSLRKDFHKKDMKNLRKTWDFARSSFNWAGAEDELREIILTTPGLVEKLSMIAPKAVRVIPPEEIEELKKEHKKYLKEDGFGEDDLEYNAEYNPAPYFIDGRQFKDMELPDDVIEEILRAHVEREKARRDKDNKMVESTKELFLKRLGQAVQNRVIPEMFLMRAGAVVPKVTTFFNDIWAPSQMKDSAGRARVDLGIIQIKRHVMTDLESLNDLIEMDATSMQKLIFHELFHTLEGCTVMKKSRIVDEEDDGGDVEDFPDIDFHLIRRGLGYSGKRIFLWLDEGVTETLARELEPEVYNTYEDEVRLIEKLLTCGSRPLSKETLFKAYIEDYDPTIPRSDRIPYWKAFIRSVNDAYAPRFLQKLDDYIKKYGVRTACETIVNNWTEILKV